MMQESADLRKYWCPRARIRQELATGWRGCWVRGRRQRCVSTPQVELTRCPQTYHDTALEKAVETKAVPRRIELTKAVATARNRALGRKFGSAAPGFCRKT